LLFEISMALRTVFQILQKSGSGEYSTGAGFFYRIQKNRRISAGAKAGALILTAKF